MNEHNFMELISTYLILAAYYPSLTNSPFSMFSTTKGWLFPRLLFFLLHFLLSSFHFCTSGVPRHNKSHWLLVCKAYTKPWRRFDKNTKILWKIMLWQMKSLKRAWPACFLLSEVPIFLIHSLKPSIFLYGIRCWWTVEEQVQVDYEEQGMQDCESNKCLFLST